MQVPRLLEEKCDGKAWPRIRQWFLSCDEDTGDKRQKQKIERHQKSVLPSTQSKMWGGGRNSTKQERILPDRKAAQRQGRDTD